MSNEAGAEVRQWAATTVFEGEDRFRWIHGEVTFEPLRLRSKPLPGYPPVVALLSQELYARLYTRAPPRGPRGVEDRLLQQEFVQALARANATGWSWVRGFTVVERREDTVTVRHRSGALRVVAARDCESVGAEGEVRLRVPGGSSHLQPGWYHVRGEEEHAADEAITARLYWNVGRAGAALLVKAVTTEMNAAKVPFHFKALDDPQRFVRADSAVLYLPKDAWAGAAPALERVHAAVAPYLRADVPALTKRLARGLSAADNPVLPGAEAERGDEESFGSHRCRLVAEGLWEAFSAGGTTPEARLEAVRARFAREGLSVDHPYLNAGSEDVYTLRLREPPLPISAVPMGR